VEFVKVCKNYLPVKCTGAITRSEEKVETHYELLCAGPKEKALGLHIVGMGVSGFWRDLPWQ
jgi:hypothetical protein